MEDPTQDAPYSRRLGGEESYWTMGYLMTWLAEGKDTDGRYSLAEVVARRGTEPPPHTPANEDEAYYLLEGEMTFQVGGKTIEAGPGDHVWLPRGVQHAPAANLPEIRTLVLITPAGLEKFFEEVGEPVTDPSSPPEGPPDIERLVAVGRKHGIEMAPPPA